ncbi:MAG TPA: hypothetical protein VGV59_04980 [Pyrinomonadaceae bacterium]|nr:hypothetical protein [Pyrinomonadaceae bacterium]
MNKGQEAAQRLLAIIVIMAMLSVMGIPLTVIIFFATVVYFVWRAVQRSEQQDIKGIFDFYIAANEILRDDDKRWYGFEIAGVISDGERVLSLMNDPPPLVYFTLGALYHRAGEHEAAVEHLSYVVEGEQGDEGRRFSYSPELKRYVQVLRRLEREPAEAPQTMAAMRGLERARRMRAETMLNESRTRLKEAATPVAVAASSQAKESGASLSSLIGARQTQAHQSSTAASSSSPTPTPPPPMPPPISDVLRDVYEEEKKTA